MMKISIKIISIILGVFLLSNINIQAKNSIGNALNVSTKYNRNDTLDLNTKNTDSKLEKSGRIVEYSKLNTYNKVSREEREIFPLEIEFENFRSLTEINTYDSGEGYPWISNDGLRLYFTKLDENGDPKIYYSERIDLGSDFSNIHSLNINMEDEDNFSCWLSDDELDIYFIVRIENGSMATTLLHSSRSSIEDEFINSIEVELIGNINGFLSGPSLTTNSNQLYIYNSDYYNNILIFDRTGDDEFTLSDSLQIPYGYSPHPGSLCSNLMYYFSMIESVSNEQRLYLYERQNSNDPFNMLYCILNDSLSIQNNYLQPSVSNNGNHFAFVRGNGISWSANDLYLAYVVNTNIEYQIVVNNYPLLNNYPNPFNPTTTISFSIPVESKVNLSIHNIKGQKIKSLLSDQLAAGEHSIIWNGEDASGKKVGSGVYLYKLTLNGKTDAVKKCLLLK